MGILTMFSGLPGSGKTTEAKKMVDASTKQRLVRVNRDDLRTMMFNYNMSFEREDMVTVMQKNIIILSNSAGYDVVVDDTNLTEKARNRWNEFARQEGMQIEWKVMDTPIEECIRRDNLRTGKSRVGRAVIENLALRAGMIKFPKSKKLVVFDIDGVLADCTHRMEHLRVRPKRHTEFHAAIPDDTPIPAMVSEIRRYFSKKDYIVVLLTARNEATGHMTVDWLAKHEIPYHHIIMRRFFDRRPSAECKEEALGHLPFDRIEMFHEDNPHVIAMLKGYNIPVKECVYMTWDGS